MASRRPSVSNGSELDVIAWLQDQDDLKPLGRFVLNQWPKTARLPLVVVQHIGDSNGTRILGRYGGEMRLQFDLYSRELATEGRALLKEALRTMRGTIGSLNGVHVVIADERDTGVDPSGAFRQMVDAVIFWEE